MFCADDIPRNVPRNDTSNENDSTFLEVFNFHSKVPSWCAEMKPDLKNHGETLFENDVPGMMALHNGTLKYDASRRIKIGFRLSDGLKKDLDEDDLNLICQDAIENFGNICTAEVLYSTGAKLETTTGVTQGATMLVNGTTKLGVM